MLNLIKKIVGTKNDREVKRIRPYVEKINSFEAPLQRLSDDDLLAKTDEFKSRIREATARLRTDLEEARAQAVNSEIEQREELKSHVEELDKELRGIVKDRPIEPAELSRAQASLTLTLPGSWETMSALAASIGNIVTYGLDDRYYDSFADKVRAQTIQGVTAVAGEIVRPDQLIWVVVGDRSKIEPGLRELKLGEIRLIDTEGKPVASR